MYTKDAFGNFDCSFDMHWLWCFQKMMLAGRFFLKQDSDLMNLINWTIFELCDLGVIDFRYIL